MRRELTEQQDEVGEPDAQHRAGAVVALQATDKQQIQAVVTRRSSCRSMQPHTQEAMQHCGTGRRAVTATGSERQRAENETVHQRNTAACNRFSRAKD